MYIPDVPIALRCLAGNEYAMLQAVAREQTTAIARWGGAVFFNCVGLISLQRKMGLATFMGIVEAMHYRVLSNRSQDWAT